MLVKKEKIRRIIQDHKIASFQKEDEDELVNIFYEAFTMAGKEQEENLATKEDIKMLMQMMDKRFEDMQKSMDKRFEAVDKRFEAVDKRFEDMNKRFTMMFTIVNIGLGIIILLTVLFKFVQV